MQRLWALILLALILTGCITDDLVFDAVAERISIQNPIDSLAIGDSFTLDAAYFNEVGIEEAISIEWQSSDETVLTVSEEGIITGQSMGQAHVIAAAMTADTSLTDSLFIIVGDRTSQPQLKSRRGSIRTTSSYALSGDFTMEETPDGILISFGEDYVASSALPGLYVYLTNNPNTNNGAFEIGEVTTFGGAHQYLVTSDEVQINTYQFLLYYCKPFNVKVGDGEIGD